MKTLVEKNCEQCGIYMPEPWNYQKYCKDCLKERRKRFSKIYNETHVAEIKAQRKLYNERNKKRIKKRNKKYKEDHKEELKKYRDEHKDEMHKRKQELYREHIESSLFRSAKTRAKKRGMEFNITVDDIIVPENCPIFNFPLVVGKAHFDSPSVDRIDNKKGYIKGNIHVISSRANSIKNDATFEEFEKIYLYWKKQREQTHDQLQ